MKNLVLTELILKNLKKIVYFIIKKNSNFFLIGGSMISTLGYDLKQRLKNFNYSHISFSNFIYLPGFNKVFKKYNRIDYNFSEKNNFVRDIFLSTKTESIVLIGAYYQLFLNETYYHEEAGKVNEWGAKIFT